MEEAITALTSVDQQDHSPLLTQPASRRFLIALLHDVGRIEEAASHIERWITADAAGKNAIEAGEITGYAGMFSEMRRFDLAATLLTSLGNRPGNVADDVFLSLARLHLEMNQPDKARDWLMAWRLQATETRATGRQATGGQAITPDKLEAFVVLALDAGLSDLALVEVRQAKAIDLSEQVLAILAETAFFAGHADTVEWLEARVGTGFHAARPVFAAELAAERKQSRAGAAVGAERVCGPEALDRRTDPPGQRVRQSRFAGCRRQGTAHDRGRIMSRRGRWEPLPCCS